MARKKYVVFLEKDGWHVNSWQPRSGLPRHSEAHERRPHKEGLVHEQAWPHCKQEGVCRGQEGLHPVNSRGLQAEEGHIQALLQEGFEEVCQARRFLVKSKNF